LSQPNYTLLLTFFSEFDAILKTQIFLQPQMKETVLASVIPLIPMLPHNILMFSPFFGLAVHLLIPGGYKHTALRSVTPLGH
jgi:hypothetical protein